MSTPVYSEDVELGDEFGPLSRTVSDAQVRQFLAIRGGVPRASRFTDPEVARREGLAGPIVPGSMSTALISQLIRGWSPTVTLRSLDVVFRQFVPHNEPLLLRGTVTGKRAVEAGALLDCDVVMEDSRGGRLVIGRATVELASRHRYPVP